VKELDNLILKAIEEGLQKLGSSVLHVTMYYAENKFNLPREEIPRQPERFEEVLREIYDAAMYHVVAAINESIFRKLGLPVEEGCHSLKEAIDKAKKLWTQRETSA